MKFSGLAIVSLFLITAIRGGSSEQCGWQASGALCLRGYCCSKYGWCGTTAEYCTNCQSQCEGGGPTDDVASLISRATFEEMLKHRNNDDCLAKGFYTYDAFILCCLYRVIYGRIFLSISYWGYLVPRGV